MGYRGTKKANHGFTRHSSVSRIPISTVKSANKAAGLHFFDKDTIRFFNSKIQPVAYTKDGLTAYFISSEQMDYNSPRKYSIRKSDLKTGVTGTVGEFGEFSSVTEANQALKKIIGTDVSKSKVAQTLDSVIAEMEVREANQGKPKDHNKCYNGWTNYDTWATMLVLDNSQPSSRWLDAWRESFAKKIKAGKFDAEAAELVVKKYLVPVARGSKKPIFYDRYNEFTPETRIDPKKVNAAEIIRSLIDDIRDNQRNS